MDCGSSDFPVHHQLPELTQIHVHWAGDAIQPSHPLSSPSPPTFNLSSIRVFSNESVLRIRWPQCWSFSYTYPSDILTQMENTIYISLFITALFEIANINLRAMDRALVNWIMERSYIGSQIQEMLDIWIRKRSLICVLKWKNGKCRTVTVDWHFLMKGD